MWCKPFFDYITRAMEIASAQPVPVSVVVVDQSVLDEDGRVNMEKVMAKVLNSAQAPQFSVINALTSGQSNPIQFFTLTDHPDRLNVPTAWKTFWLVMSILENSLIVMKGSSVETILKTQQLIDLNA